VALIGGHAYAEQALPTEPASPSERRPERPEEESFLPAPAATYGEFNEEADEAQDTRFFQYGRFFGVSVGTGLSGVTGNRGLLWQGGTPMVDLKLHSWLDFNFALALGLNSVRHFYEVSSQRTDISLTRVGVDLKYYFSTQNLSAPLAFSNPYLLAGVSSLTKTETNLSDETVTDETTYALGAGFGFEFALSPRKAYFTLEWRANFANFRDTNSSKFLNTNGIPDLAGFFYTTVGSFLFTW
jgi:hypothetical protein